MQLESAERTIPRRQALAVSPAPLRRVAIFATAALVLIVATGATVRLTGSGLGCRHWPGCEPTHFIPKRGFHSDVEFGNRVIASFTVLSTVVLAVGALCTRPLARSVKAVACLVFAGTAAQAA